jgi:flavin reductase (DIM6/NTAB) family NADH-FMN oxidoreductase RutF
MTIEAALFKDALSRFASGVTVVTTVVDGVPHGLTVSAFSSVSAAPPRVLICLNNSTDSKPLIDRSGAFAVHILGSAHAVLGPRFAKLVPGLGDPFEGLSHRVESTGCPILVDCLAWLDCQVESRIAVGDNTIFIGSVQAAGTYGVAAEAEPLLYYRRAWRMLHPDSLEPLKV